MRWSLDRRAFDRVNKQEKYHTMRAIRLAVACVAVLAAAAGYVRAGVILNAPDIGSRTQINFFEPIGNSFTAEDPLVSAALFLDAVNPGFDPTDPIRFELFDGVGAGGTLLFNQSFVVPGSSTGFFDVDLSAVPLVVGNDYSFVASIVGSSPYWGLIGTNGSAGSGISSGIIDSFNMNALRVTPLATTPVPEPSTFALLGIGAVFLIGYSRRRKRKAA